MDENTKTNTVLQKTTRIGKATVAAGIIGGPLGIALIKGRKAVIEKRNNNSILATKAAPGLSKAARSEFNSIQEDVIKNARKIYREQMKTYNADLSKNPKALKPDAYEILSKEYCKKIVDFTNKNPDSARIIAKENPLVMNYLVFRGTNPNAIDPAQAMFDSLMGRNPSLPIKTTRNIRIGQGQGMEDMKVKLRSLTPNVTESTLSKSLKTAFVYSNPYTLVYAAWKMVEPESIRKKREAKINQAKSRAFKYLNHWNDKILAKTKHIREANKVKLLQKAWSIKTIRYFIAPPAMLYDLGKKFIPSPIRSFFNRGKNFFQNAIDRVQKFADKITDKAVNLAKKALNRLASLAFQGIKQLSSAFPPLRVALEAAHKLLKPFLNTLGKLLSGKFNLPSFEDLLKKLTFGFGRKFVDPKSKVFWIVAIGITLFGFSYFLTIIIITTIFNAESGNEDAIGGGNNPIGGSPITQPPIPGLTLTLNGPTQVQNGEEISYTVTININPSLLPVPVEQISIYSDIPTNTTLQETSTNAQVGQNTVSWSLADIQNRNGFTFTLLPSRANIRVANSVYAIATVVQNNNGSSLFPPADTTPEQDTLRRDFASYVASKADVVAVYKEAATRTGISWEFFAGLHNFETGGGLQMDRSLVSGRPIGGNEPDVVRAGGCIENSEPGRPVPVPGGCGFKTLLDSAIYAGNLLSGKNNGKTPSSFEEYAKVASYYNGGGNANCGEGLPYEANCPPAFIGDDDPYAMNKFDRKHDQMYLLYCADFTRCNPPELIQRIGIMTAADALAKYSNL